MAYESVKLVKECLILGNLDSGQIDAHDMESVFERVRVMVGLLDLFSLYFGLNSPHLVCLVLDLLLKVYSDVLCLADSHCHLPFMFCLQIILRNLLV